MGQGNEIKDYQAHYGLDVSKCKFTMLKLFNLALKIYLVFLFCVFVATVAEPTRDQYAKIIADRPRPQPSSRPFMRSLP